MDKKDQIIHRLLVVESRHIEINLCHNGVEPNQGEELCLSKPDQPNVTPVNISVSLLNQLCKLIIMF